MSPGLARIGRFVNAVADGKIGAVQSLAAGGINNVGIGRGNGDGADRLSRLVVEDGIPGAAVVVGLPHAAVYLRHIVDVRLAGNAGGGPGAAAAKWADHAPVQLLIGVLGNLCVECAARNGEQEKNEYANDGCGSHWVAPLGRGNT